MSNSKFSLFQSHIDLAHSLWKELLSPTDYVIDATCGNGHDTLFLSSLVPNGKIWAIDIQSKALQSAESKLQPSHPVTFLQQCHSSLPEVSVKLIIYNLGYLPGHDKSLTTQTDTTLQSLKEAKKRLLPGGVISITCYPGHAEGALEEKRLTEHLSSLSPKEWSYSFTQWPNRSQSPSLIIIQKKL